MTAAATEGDEVVRGDGEVRVVTRPAVPLHARVYAEEEGLAWARGWVGVTVRVTVTVTVTGERERERDASPLPK